MDNGYFAVDQEKCIGCGVCVDVCPEKVVRFVNEMSKAFVCVGCGECVRYCPREALVDETSEVTRV